LGESTYQKGQSLESKVANLYLALRFEVKRNVNLGGHQIDLVVSKYFSGVGPVSCMVEVKNYQGNLGINEVTKFINVSKHLIGAGKIQSAVCVTSANFTQDARAAVLDEPSIRLLTFRELEKDLFNYSQCLVEWCRQFEGTSVYSTYVPLRGQRIPRGRVTDIVAYVDDWFVRGENLLIISGDFGSGKTTIAERVLYRQAERYLSTNDSPFPILLPLRNFRRFSQVFDFVQGSVQKNYGISIAQNHFEMQLKSGRFVLVLDGFDEIDTGAKASDRARYMDQLSYLVGQGSPCVLTTRPTYFESFNDFASVLRVKLPKSSRRQTASFNQAKIAKHLGISLLYQFPVSELANAIAISVLSPNEIKKHLRRRANEILKQTGYSYQQVVNFIFSVYDLEDLVQRPLLLDMVVTTIIHGDIDITQQGLTFGPAELYEFYTLACAQRDIDKDGIVSFLNAEDRLKACRHLAVFMFERATILLSSEQILSSLEAIRFSTLTPTGMTSEDFVRKASTDIRVCSFLTMDGNEYLKFSHTSFMEFFFAQEVVQRCNSSLEYLRQQTRSASGSAVIYFLGSFARSDSNFSRQVQYALSSIAEASVNWTPEDVRFNHLILRIAWTSGVLLTNRHLQRCEISDSRFAKSQLLGAYFDGVSLKNLLLRDSKLERCVFVKCTFDDVAISKVTIDECNFQVVARELNISDSTFHDGAFSVENISKADAAELERTQSRDWLLERCRFKGVAVNLSGKGLVIDTIFEDCSLGLGGGSYLETGSTLRVTDSIVSGSRMRRGSNTAGSWLNERAAAAFERCELNGLWMNTGQIQDALSPNKNSNIDLVDCHGVILTETVQSQVDGQMLASLARKYSNIAFLDLAYFSNLRHAKGKFGLTSKECDLETLCARLVQYREYSDILWSLNRVREISARFQIKLEKMKDFTEHLKTLAISSS
jgi:uncharacterized protein YjbI with pentapeptide repeats